VAELERGLVDRGEQLGQHHQHVAVVELGNDADVERAFAQAKAEGKPREDFIVTIDRSDDQTAFVKVRCQLPPRYFTDYLVAMKLNDGWKIVSKSYRYDLRE